MQAAAEGGSDSGEPEPLRRCPTIVPLAFLILALLTALPTLALGKPCSIKTEAGSAKQVQIQPTGAAPFTLQVNKLPVQVTAGAKGQATLLVESPLRFTASHPMNKLGIQLTKRTRLADGRIILAKGLTPEFLEQSGNPEGGPLSVNPGLSELTPLTPLSLPCSALRVPETAVTRWTPGLELPDKVIEHVLTRNVISLYARRKKVDPLRIRFSAPLQVVAKKGAWLRLQAQWSDGSQLQGWVPKAEVSILRKDPGYEGKEEGGLWGICSSGGHRPSPVRFKLRSHAPIHEAAGGRSGRTPLASSR